MAKLLLRAFQFPGNAACSALGVTDSEDRMMLRTLVDMLVWNLVVIIAAFVLFG